MQFQGQGKAPLGVVYNTTMSRADAALTLALLYGLEGKKEARVAAVAVSGSGLDAAAFCDVVARFYAGQGPFPNSNRVLPVGLAADGPLPPDSPMVKAAVERQYSRGIQKVNDTAEVPALIRNSLTGQVNGNAVVVLSAPATYLARTMNLAGTRELIKAKVKMLVISDSGAPQDVVAARRILAEWPTPIVLSGRAVGEAARYPSSSIEKDFAWALSHPVVDAYRAYQKMPYDTPGWDMAAALYAVHPDAGLFQVSEPGTIEVQDNGDLSFTVAPDGKHRSLMVDPAQKEKIIQSYVEMASAKPVPRPSFRPPPKKVDDPAKATEVKPVTK